ncbi:MAG: PsbP-related protein [Candidatus Daviesbacteria bacterium]|nr:PsbP-related protein [Candidatus Daviesbacteria bacterium]
MNKSARFDKGVIDPKLIIGAVVIGAIVVFFIATGNFKFSASVNNQQASTSSQSSTETSSSQKEEPSVPKTKTYTNSTYGLSLEYPEGWSMRENPAAGIVVAFGSPKESSDDKFVDNVNVSFTDLSSKGDLTLEQLTDAWLKETESAPDFNLLDRKSTSTAGEAAEQLVYSYNSKGMDTKGMVVITKKGEMAYIVTYTAEQTSYDNFVDAANTVVTSLRID